MTDRRGEQTALLLQGNNCQPDSDLTPTPTQTLTMTAPYSERLRTERLPVTLESVPSATAWTAESRNTAGDPYGSRSITSNRS